MSLTKEQLDIVGVDVEPGEVMVVQALAGTGKTTTLCEWAKARPHMNIRYVAFNRSVKEEAVKRFPPHVTCSTIDGLVWEHRVAHGIMGTPPKEIFDKFTPLYTPVSALKCSYTNLRNALRTVHAFCKSSSTAVLLSHVPRTMRVGQTKQAIDEGTRDRLCLMAQDMYNLMESGTLPCGSFDVAEKIMAQKETFVGCQTILVDESQDLNAPMIKTVLNQLDHAGVVFVGDPYQHIYQFKKCISIFASPALEGMCSSVRHMRLTESFRFGPVIAACANQILLEREDVETIGVVRVVGKGSSDGKVDSPIPASNIFALADKLPKREKIAVLFRTNRELLSFFLKHELKFHVKGNVKKETLVRLSTAYQTNPGKFMRDWEERDDEGSDEVFLYELIAEHQGDITDILEHLKTRSVQSRQTGVVLSTVHQSKGLEFHTVVMWGDTQRKSKDNPPSEEERNIRYVAATRAKHVLYVCEDISLHEVRKVSKELEESSNAPTRKRGGLDAWVVKRKRDRE